MTLPALLHDHIHVTEREPDGTWEDCTWCAGLEWYRLTHDASKPATHAEAQSLRDASGKPPTGGSNIGDFKRGVSARYHVSLSEPVLSGFAALWSALKPGCAALIQGSMSAFGPTDPLSKWDRNFDGGHATMVARLDSQDRVWWCDPEAPTGVGYEGVWITKAQLERFVNAFGGQHLVQKIKYAVPTPAIEDPMDPIIAYKGGQTATIKGPANIRSAPHVSATLFRSVPTGSVEKQSALVGTVKGDADPGNAGNTAWLAWWANGRYEFTAIGNIESFAATVVESPYTKATQDAAVAAQQAADQKVIDAVNAKANACQTALDAATAAKDAAVVAERARIADAEATRIRAL